MTSRHARLAEVAELIDRNRLNGTIGNMTTGEYIADKLDRMGYLALDEEWGLRDHSNGVYVDTQRNIQSIAKAMKGVVLRRFGTRWEEYRG